MCEKYVNNELIKICSIESDMDECGCGCNHCPYSKEYGCLINLEEFDNYDQYFKYIKEESEKQNKRDIEALSTIKKAKRIFKIGFKLENILKLKNVSIFSEWRGITNIKFENSVFGLVYDTKDKNKKILGCTWKD